MMNFKFFSFILFLSIFAIACDRDNYSLENNDMSNQIQIDAGIEVRGLPTVPFSSCGTSVSGGGIGGIFFEESCCEVRLQLCDVEGSITPTVIADACLGGPDYIGTSYKVKYNYTIDGGPEQDLALSLCHNVETNSCAHVEPFNFGEGDFVCNGPPIVNDGQQHNYCMRAYLRIYPKPDCQGSPMDFVQCGNTELCFVF